MVHFFQQVVQELERSPHFALGLISRVKGSSPKPRHRRWRTRARTSAPERFCRPWRATRRMSRRRRESVVLVTLVVELPSQATDGAHHPAAPSHLPSNDRETCAPDRLRLTPERAWRTTGAADLLGAQTGWGILQGAILLPWRSQPSPVNHRKDTADSRLRQGEVWPPIDRKTERVTPPPFHDYSLS